MKIAVFGLGYVGTVSGACLARLGHEVVGVDIDPGKIDLISQGVSPIVEEGISELVAAMVAAGRLRASSDAAAAIVQSDAALISVGTPSTHSGALSLVALDAVTAAIGEGLRGRCTPFAVIYRSTMLPGTLENRLMPLLAEQSGRAPGDGYEVCYNPEFLREGSSIRDFYDAPFTIAGASTPAGFAAVRALYAGIDAPLVETDYKTAESVKYLCNIYHAVKISFANEAGALLGQLGVDARKAAEIFCMDDKLNISKAYLRPGFAFGGSCLPKDLRAFLSLARDQYCDLPMLGAVLDSNQRHIGRAFEKVAAIGKRRIALFGLSFKGGTDDLRESPFVTLAEQLIGKGYQLKIYDPNVESARLMGANKAFIEREIPHFKDLLQPSVAATLDGAEAIIMGHAPADDLTEIVRLAAGRPVVDLQGARAMEAAAGDYRGLCW